VLATHRNTGWRGRGSATRREPGTVPAVAVRALLCDRCGLHVAHVVGALGEAQVQLKDVVKVLAMAEAALKAKSVAAERKAFVAATHAYEQGAALQAMAHSCVQHGQGDLAKCMEQVRVGTRCARIVHHPQASNAPVFFRPGLKP
jgi:hypothetical protein